MWYNIKKVNMKKKVLIITISIIMLIAIAIALFCVIYFNVNNDISKDIDEIFAQNEITYYYPDSNPNSGYYSLPSSTAKEIVNKHLKGLKFKHTTSHPIIYGNSRVIKCGEMYLAESYVFAVKGKKYKLTDEIKLAFKNIDNEITSVATYLPVRPKETD